MKRFKKVLNYTLGAFAILYGLIILFPQVLFSNSLTHKNFKIYYHSGNIDIDKLTIILDESSNLLKASSLFNAQKQQEVFLCNSFDEFTFFAPRSRKSFAVTFPVVQNIFISQSDISANKVNRSGSENNLRSLSGVIAHETTHVALEDKLGLLKYKLLPNWKNEGYCDYIAKESSYDEKLGWSKICNNTEEETSPSFTYFKYKTYVEYLLEKENIPLDTFLLKDFDGESVAFKSKKRFCANSSK